jgi:tRNA 2-(methylsulfanyl)-N6-isopentenyladenosine37 hydroxylase
MRAREDSPGARDDSPGTWDGSPGAPDGSKGAREVVQGAREVVQGAREVVQGAREVVQGARKTIPAHGNGQKKGKTGPFVRNWGVWGGLRPGNLSLADFPIPRPCFAVEVSVISAEIRLAGSLENWRTVPALGPPPSEVFFFILAPWTVADNSFAMLLFREKVPDDWLPKVLNHLPEVLVDHAHLERKAATTALNLEKYRDLYSRVEELNAIAIEELQHFQLVLNLLKQRGIPFGQAYPCPWITGLMRAIRNGRREQAIDHLLCCALIEGRSCEKFQILARALESRDPELARFYGSLVESEGNHYATYILMARDINDAETDRRLNDFLDLDAQLIREPNPRPMLH